MESSIPLITIIGQKSSGKSSLFRYLTKKYAIAITDKKPLPIINYVEEIISLENNVYKLVDTPTFIFSPKNEIEKGISEQIEALLRKSDLVLWIIDEINERTILLKRYLQKVKSKQILLLRNKIDLVKAETNPYSYKIFQLQNFLPISVLQKINLDKMIEKTIELLPSLSNIEVANKTKKLNLIIFGPPNSGKSTLMNYLLAEKRSLATPIAGTTQEPVISQWNWKKVDFQLVDTAGITKDQSIKTMLWKNCDLAWVVIDITLPLTKQILQIIHLGERYNKPLIIIINKCDLVEDKKTLIKELRKRMKSLKYAPIICLSALKGTGVSSLMKILGEMLKEAQKKAKKKELETIVKKMLDSNPPKYHKGGRLKIYFAKHEPGLIHYFIFFVNNSQWVHFSYQRYIINYLRKNLCLEYLPIKIVLKKSE